MLFIYLGVYTLFLLFIWGFCIVAKLHAYKFKNFSSHIRRFTPILIILLLILSILGYICVWILAGSSNSYNIQEFGKNQSQIKEIEY